MTTAATTSSNSTHLPPLHGIRSFPSLPNTELATTTMHTVQPSMESTLVHSTTDIITNTTTDYYEYYYEYYCYEYDGYYYEITAADITTNPITNPISVNTPNYSGLAAGAIKPRQQSLIMGTGSPLIELHDINLQSRPRTPLSSSSVAKVAQDTTTTTHAATIIEPKNMPADTFTTPDDLDALHLSLSQLKGADDPLQLSSIYFALSQKFYYCGFVYKKNELGADGKPILVPETSGHTVRAVNGQNYGWSYGVQFSNYGESLTI
ncbi:hypothetical protein BASA83_012803 [Batrachochytrium salamandrivorans]|nr:hypothetical protein BASA83_012803 [Batrachochytrium salamandrivorans]